MTHMKVIVLRPVKALNPNRTRFNNASASMTAVTEQMLERGA